MATTPTHGVYYPPGSSAPNVPVVMQTSAESVEAALNKITKAPTFIATKTVDQPMPLVNTFYDVTWQTETLKQGITHDLNSSSIVVPEDGLYEVNSRLSFNSGTAIVGARLQVNGVDLVNTLMDAAGSAQVFPKLRVIETLQLRAGDVVKVRMQSNTANVTLSNASTVAISKKAVY